MEADVEGEVGTGLDERTTRRNGHRDRVPDTRLGNLRKLHLPMRWLERFVFR
jgi:hypothetical protein